MNSSIQFSRQDYLNEKCTHEQYYAQFVTPAGIDLVKRSEAFKTLTKHKTNDLSFVPVNKWDLIGTAHDAVNGLKTAGDFWSLGGSVCINKAIARHILEA